MLKGFSNKAEAWRANRVQVMRWRSEELSSEIDARTRQLELETADARKAIAAAFVVFAAIALGSKEATETKPALTEPPMLGEILLRLFVKQSMSDPILGDFEEDFRGNIQRHGISRAKLIYWIEVARCIGPLAISTAKRWGFWAFLASMVRAKIGG